LRVLHASAWYPPAHIGGTEVYVTGLVRELRACDVESRVMAPGASHGSDYEFDGTLVRRYPVNEEPSVDELRGILPHHDFSRFREILEEERPDVYHQHSWTRGLGGAHLHAAREAGLTTVLTVHVANSICLRGTMNLFGKETCDGRIDPTRCGACWSQSRGAPQFVSRVLGMMPSGLSDKLGRLQVRPHKVATALSARSLAERQRADFLRLTADADRIVAVCRWLYEALLINNVPSEKLVLSRQGVDPTFADEAMRAAPTAKTPADENFRLIFLGRWHPVKGIDVLVRAIGRIPRTVPITLAIHAVGDGPEERAYSSEVRRLVGNDSRISIEAPIPRGQLAQALASADALAVPSLWLETGPLVVLEAKAAGLPIIGSRLGGIAELVEEPTDGMLVDPGDVTAWADAIRTVVTRRAKKPRAKKVRTMRDVASEMTALYRSLV
jgi:glycosyltransferase involved in cell wall biosynthesis